jgi:hypothetical protein
VSRHTKEDVVREIADMLGVVPPPMSTGSTEPKDIFVEVVKVLGLGLDTAQTKPQLARDIVESDGLVWGPACESRGGTVTMAGLERVALVVQRLTA